MIGGYQRAAKMDKSKILDEFVAVAGCHRKHAIRLLTSNGLASAVVPAVARRTYDEAVRQALIVLWEAAGIPHDAAGLADWIAACWPLIAEDPDPVRWAREYGEAHAVA